MTVLIIILIVRVYGIQKIFINYSVLDKIILDSDNNLRTEEAILMNDGSSIIRYEGDSMYPTSGRVGNDNQEPFKNMGFTK